MGNSFLRSRQCWEHKHSGRSDWQSEDLAHRAPRPQSDCLHLGFAKAQFPAEYQFTTVVSVWTDYVPVVPVVTTTSRKPRAGEQSPPDEVRCTLFNRHD